MYKILQTTSAIFQKFSGAFRKHIEFLKNVGQSLIFLETLKIFSKILQKFLEISQKFSGIFQIFLKRFKKI